jgi:hypothetical protein
LDSKTFCDVGADAAPSQGVCLKGLFSFSFGNGSQAIEIATAHFSLFFQTRREIIEQSN